MVGWHHRLNGHGFGWTLGVGDGQGGLACCSSWSLKESDTTERLNWTELGHECWCWEKGDHILKGNPSSLPNPQGYCSINLGSVLSAIEQWWPLNRREAPSQLALALAPSSLAPPHTKVKVASAPWGKTWLLFTSNPSLPPKVLGIHRLGFPGGSVVKSPPANAGAAGNTVQFLGREDPLEKEMPTHSSILAWRILWTEEPGGLQFMVLQRRHHWVTNMYIISNTSATDAKRLFGKDPDAGKDWRQKEKRVEEDEMVRQHLWLNGHKFEQTLRDSER